MKNGTFTSKKYRRILISSIGAWFVSLIDGCADTILAGAFLDEMAVSAISLVQPISSVISFLAYLISVGTAVMFSRESGAFRKEKAYGYVGMGVISSIGVAVLLVAGMLVLREPLLTFYGASGEISAIAREYYTCEIFFAALYPLYYIIFQLVSVDGDDIIGFLACLASAVSNMVASFLLVGPFGVKGLAFGTIIATCVGMGVYSIHFLLKANSVRLKLHFNLRELGDVMKISSSTSLTLLYIAIIDIVMNKFIISVYSDAYLPAYAVVNFILNLGAIFCSLYEGGSGFISVAYGEKNPAGIRQTMRIAYRALLITSAAMMLILEFIAPYVPNLYGITDPAVRAASVFATRVIAIGCPFTAAYYLFCSYYPAIGRVGMGHLISVVYMLIAPLALAIPLGLAFGFNGLSIGFSLTSAAAVAVGVLTILIRRGRKAVPLMLEDSDEEFVSNEIRLCQEEITGLCGTVKAELAERGVDSIVSNEVQLILEESLMTIMDANPGRKVIAQCDMLISAKSLRLITRDNGRIFDITDVNAKVKDLRSYVLALLMERNEGRTNTTTISFNRNSYLWNLEAN